MMNLSGKQGAWLLLPLALLSVHALWVVSSISAERKNAEKPLSTEAFVLADRVRPASDNDMKTFSLLLGVDPVTAEPEADSEIQDIRYITLNELDPKLLAVDEVSGESTARLWVDNGKLQAAQTNADKAAESSLVDSNQEMSTINPALKLYSLTLGETLFHYRVQELGLNYVRLVFEPSIEHEWTDSNEDIILRLFKRVDAGATDS